MNSKQLGPETSLSAAPPRTWYRVLDLAEPGDLVICLGAGNSTRWAATLPDELQALQDAGGKV